MTYYDILEVSPTASKEVIEASWKAQSRKYHPEGSQPNAERIRLVNNAHDILSDPQKRKQYDLQLKAQRPQVVPVRAENKKAQRQRVTRELEQRRDLVDGLVELTNLAFDLFSPKTPIRVTRRRR